MSMPLLHKLTGLKYQTMCFLRKLKLQLTDKAPPEAEFVVVAHGVERGQEVDDLLEHQLPVSEVKLLLVHPQPLINVQTCKEIRIK